MEYRVTVVEECDLPVGTDWAIASGCAGADLFIRRSHSAVDGGLCELLGEAWAASVKFGAGLPVAV